MSEKKEKKMHDWYGNAISRNSIEMPTVEVSESWILDIELVDDSEGFELLKRPPTAPKLPPKERSARRVRVIPPGASNF